MWTTSDGDHSVIYLVSATDREEEEFLFPEKPRNLRIMPTDDEHTEHNCQRIRRASG
jgi:hypothetical protein